MPAATLASIRRTGLALKGPLSTPIGGGFRSVNVRLREEFNLYANVRPVRTIVPGRYENIDIVLMRENVGGFYVAHDYYIPVGDDPRAVAMSTGTNTRHGCRRIARFAYDYALKHGRKKMTIVHKANVLKALTGIFLEPPAKSGRSTRKAVRSQTTASSTPARCKLVLNPWQFDMLRDETCSATSCRTRWPGWSAGWAWRRERTSATAPRSSRRCTARRRTSRGRASPTRSR